MNRNRFLSVLLTFGLCCPIANSMFILPATLAGEEKASRTIEKSLDLAGENKPEIKQAIQRCSFSDLEKKSIRFLVQHMPESDLKTLTADFLVSNVKLAIEARSAQLWAQQVPEQVFLNDVLPYASINERRDAWRKDFYQRFKGLVKDCKSTGEAAQQLNKHVFKILNVRYSTKRKKPDQSPYESMETGLASCTGLSVILTDACRSVGVPARLTGTPLWVNKRGNHTWVEVWDGGQWKFTGACEYDPNGLNRGWFKGIASQADEKDPVHRIYATSWQETGTHFPMVWKRKSVEVPGVDVTWRYTGKRKPAKTGEYRIAIQLYDKDGRRLSGKLEIVNGSQTLGVGQSRNESNDANDYYEIDLKPGKYQVRYKVGNQSKTSELSVLQQQYQIHKIKLD